VKPDIIEKLNRELEQDIVSERQVVYILVEARKLLEQQGTLHNFRALKLCIDWAVHPKLRGPDAQGVLRQFDAYDAEYQKSGVTMAEFKLEPLHEFMSHRRTIVLRPIIGADELARLPPALASARRVGCAYDILPRSSHREQFYRTPCSIQLLSPTFYGKDGRRSVNNCQN
jgi:hypothetical protein